MTGWPVSDSVVRLRDGRRLAYAEWGEGLARVRPGALEDLDEEEQLRLDLVERSRGEAARTMAAENEEWARAVVEQPERCLDDLPVTNVNRWFREDPVRMAPFLRAAGEAFRQGAEGAAWDDAFRHDHDSTGAGLDLPPHPGDHPARSCVSERMDRVDDAIFAVTDSYLLDTLEELVPP